MEFQEIRAENGKMLGEIDPQRRLLRFRFRPKRKRGSKNKEFHEEYVVDLNQYLSGEPEVSTNRS